ALIDWLTVVERIGVVQLENGAQRASIDTFNRGLARMEHAPEPRNQPEFQNLTAMYLFDLSRALRQSGDVNAASDKVAKGIALMKEVVTARPDDREVRLNLAMGYAQRGAILGERGNRAEELENYRLGAAELEALCRRHPNDTRARHELMLAYSH